MPDSLYDHDFYGWSQQQADRLRRHAERARDDTVDWPNVIEEIESLGRSDLQAVESLLRNMLAHVVKLAVRPDETAAGHWRTEIAAFQPDARRRFSPGMRRLVEADLDELFADAVNQAALAQGWTGSDADLACPLSLDELLARPFQLEPAVQKVVAALPPGFGRATAD